MTALFFQHLKNVLLPSDLQSFWWQICLWETRLFSPHKKGTFSHSLLPRYFVFPFQKSNYNWSWRKVLLACLWFAQLLGSADLRLLPNLGSLQSFFLQAFFQPCLRFSLLPGLQWHLLLQSHGSLRIFTPTVLLLLFKLGKLYCSIVRFAIHCLFHSGVEPIH